MRANKIINYPAEKEVHHLGSFHTWGLAATQGAASAARLLMNLVEKEIDPAELATCDICVLLEIEEDRRIREFISLLNHKLVAQWLRTLPILCVPHGTKLKQCLPQATALAINSIMDKYRGYLVSELHRLHEEYQPDAAKWGVLGHAAEFLVAQRGLRR